jgi:hypothetical protein
MFTFHRVQDFLQRGDVRTVTLKDFVGKRQALFVCARRLFPETEDTIITEEVRKVPIRV